MHGVAYPPYRFILLNIMPLQFLYPDKAVTPVLEEYCHANSCRNDRCSVVIILALFGIFCKGLNRFYLYDNFYKVLAMPLIYKRYETILPLTFHQKADPNTCKCMLFANFVGPVDIWKHSLHLTLKLIASINCLFSEYSLW